MYDAKTINYMNNVYLPQRQGGAKASHCTTARQIQSLMNPNINVNRMMKYSNPGL